MEKEREKEIKKTTFKGHIISDARANENLGVGQKYDRCRYENKEALKKFKNQYYGSQKSGIDPYTGKRVHKSHNAAKNAYGEKHYARHASETDHIVSLKEGHNILKNDPFLSDENVKNILNDPKNYREIARSVNNQKRDTDDLVYITGVKFDKETKRIEKYDTGLTNEGKARMAAENVQAKAHIIADAGSQTAKNVASEFIGGASDAMTVAAVPMMVLGVQNLCEVASGQKSMEDAAKEMGEMSVKTVVTGGSARLAKDVISMAAEKSGSQCLGKIAAGSNEFVQLAVVSGLVFKSFVKLANNEITGAEFFDEISESGVALIGDIIGTVAGSSLAAALMPIAAATGPAGLAIGAAGFIGGMLVSSVCVGIYRYASELKDNYIGYGRTYRERLEKINQIADQAISEMQIQHESLKKMIDGQYEEWENLFDTGFQEIREALMTNDFDRMSGGLNYILKAFGEKVLFNNMEEFDEFFFSDNAVLRL